MKATKVAEADLPTRFGAFRIFGFESPDKSESALALVFGTPEESTRQSMSGMQELLKKAGAA